MNISSIGHHQHFEKIHQMKDQPKIDVKHQETAEKSISGEHFKGEFSKIDVKV